MAQCENDNMTGNDNGCYLMAMMKWETHDVKTKFSIVFKICRIKYIHIKRKYSYNTTSTNRYETNMSKWPKKYNIEIK